MGADTMMNDKKSKAAVGCLLLVFVVASAAATVTTIVATTLAAGAAADAVADAIATTATKRAQHYFPALVNWSVVENNVCAFLASLRRQEVYSCGACAGERPFANARHRFAAGGPRPPPNAPSTAVAQFQVSFSRFWQNNFEK